MNKVTAWRNAARVFGLALIAGSLIAPSAAWAGKTGACKAARENLISASKAYKESRMLYDDFSDEMVNVQFSRDAIKNTTIETQMQKFEEARVKTIKALEDKDSKWKAWQEAYKKVGQECGAISLWRNKVKALKPKN